MELDIRCIKHDSRLTGTPTLIYDTDRHVWAVDTYEQHCPLATVTDEEDCSEYWEIMEVKK